jgi:hypothetical protein
MNNILIADEVKSLNHNLVVLATLITKDDSLRMEMDTALRELIQSSASGKRDQQRLLNPSQISAGNLVEYVAVLGQLFSYLKYLSTKKDIHILVRVANAAHLLYDGSALRSLLPQEETFPRIAQLEQMMTSTFFENIVSSLHEFPISKEDCISAIYCDKSLDLVNRSRTLAEAIGNMLRSKLEIGGLVSELVEKLHNQFSRITHEGLRDTLFIEAEQSPILQVCSSISFLVLSSIRYMVHGEGDGSERSKHLLIQNYFALDKASLEDLELEWDHEANDVIPREVSSVALRLG